MALGDKVVRDRVERPKTIALKTMGHYEEGVASEIMYPGQLIVIENTADLPLVPPSVALHGSQGTQTGLFVVKEDALQGRTIDDAYAVSDIVPYLVAVPGDVFLARIDPRSSITAGTQLTSAGDGYFEAASSDIALAEAEETVNYSGEGAQVDQFIRARAI